MTEQAADLGPLAVALAKAQTEFPPITRDKKVTVQTKTGGSYSFSYAPLDSILAAVRQPLANNGLAITQTFEDGALVTLLLHESGAFVRGSLGIPTVADVQGLGSAITYLRRYAIQAVLGIAAEEDDDGNRAAGNRVVAVDVERTDDGGLIGTAEAGDKQTSDMQLRQTPDGPELGFRLRGSKGGILVEATGPLADQINDHRAAIAGKRVTVWGSIAPRTIATKTGKATYQALIADRVRVPEVGDLPKDTTPEPSDAEAAPAGLTEAESEAIWDTIEGVSA